MTAERAGRPSWAGNDLLWPMLAAALAFLAVYAVELGSFGLSIDEEIAILGTEDRLRVWLQQGRWGMSLVTWILPNFEGLPVLSTLLFGAGLLCAAWRALIDLELRGWRGATFAVVFVAFPVWPHIAQFNTLAAGFGAGIAAASVGAGLCAGDRTRHWLSGVLLMAFAASVYQTLAIYALLYLLLIAAARWTRTKGAQGSSLRACSRLLLAWLSALLAYALVQWLALRLLSVDTAYVGGFLQLDRLRADPALAVQRSWHFTKKLVNGRNPLYLGWGMALLAMSWIGLLWPISPEERGAWWRRGHTFAVFLLAIALIFLPVLVSWATLPVRAQVAWPLLAAWLAARCPFPDRRWPWVRAVALAYFAVVATSVGATLFHADLLAREADRLLSEQLVTRMREVAAGGAPAGKPIAFTISGVHRYPQVGQAVAAEMFGNSYFEYDGGSVYRIQGFWRVLGIEGFEPRPLFATPLAAAAVPAMPDWPAPGSVKLVDGVVVVRFGAPTPQQLSAGR
jgi:hypothetical protein